MHDLATLGWPRRTLIAAAMLCGLAAPAAAQPSETQIEAIREHCRSDFMAHCSGVPRGGEAALQCLQQNRASLSPACGQAVAAISPAAAPSAAPHVQPAPQPGQQEGFLQHCMAELRSHCVNVMPGGGREMRCLMESRESLSPTCREALAAAGAR